MVHNKSPNYSFLKNFCCQCWPNLRPYNRHKLNFRSTPCLFPGYSPSHKGYKCLDLNTNRLYISRDVTFNEHFFPYKKVTTPISPSNTSIVPLPFLTPSILGPPPTSNPTSNLSPLNSSAFTNLVHHNALNTSPSTPSGPSNPPPNLSNPTQLTLFVDPPCLTQFIHSPSSSQIPSPTDLSSTLFSSPSIPDHHQVPNQFLSPSCSH